MHHLFARSPSPRGSTTYPSVYKPQHYSHDFGKKYNPNPRGHMKEQTFSALEPFFIAHSKTVMRLFHEFLVAGRPWTQSPSVDYFPNLRIYALNLMAQSMSTANAPSLSAIPAWRSSLRPITVILVEPQGSINLSESVDVIKQQLEVKGSYFVERFVLDRSWDDILRWRDESNSGFSKFLNEIQALHPLECPIFDRDLVRFAPGVL
ncbi:hypothetical protein PIIN_10311 [Serendipita indica DSM 11827]|uniref:Uncharacterized protein n=1 Tax=Serendipita indica (strain DSM 11827) TaxID=1109443 RepID=G4TYC3_SERID|nr:hypothetical protein PIIN_10311 [Serendipita indica DSM 11827]